MSENSLHPFDQMRQRQRARHDAKFAKTFGPDHRNRSQDQKQAEAAQNLEAQKTARAALERSLLNPAPPTAPRSLSGRIRKDGKKISR